MSQNVRFQAKEAFKLDGRAVQLGEVLIMSPAVARLYVGRGQLERLQDEPPAVAAAAARASKPAKPPKPPKSPKGRAELETKTPSAPAPADEPPADEAADDEPPADEVS
jgi:hypothetical protein